MAGPMEELRAPSTLHRCLRVGSTIDGKQITGEPKADSAGKEVSKWQREWGSNGTSVISLHMPLHLRPYGGRQGFRGTSSYKMHQARAIRLVELQPSHTMWKTSVGVRGT